jgi:RimJ/RimL family protein N-acetyltransferase
MMVEPITLQGRAIRLEPLRDYHAEAIAEVATPEIFAYLFPPAEYTEIGFRDQIRGLTDSGGFCLFATVLQESGRAIGMTSYLDIRPAHRSLEIGFTWIGAQWQGTAVNPEAKWLLLEHAFEQLGAVRVQLKTDLRNVQSQGAIEKLGAVKEGVLRKHMTLPDGHIRDTVMYSITDDEWPDVRKRLLERLATFD